MKKSKLKIIIPLLLIILLCLSVGAYAGYTLSAKDVTYTKSDGTTVTVKEALDELRAKQLESPSIVKAMSDDMLTKTTNTTVKDLYGNQITIPAGFKIKFDVTTNNAITVNQGIVIVDSNENEFVWIPTGKIYTDTERTEANAKTIELNRYTFDGNGNPTAHGDAVIDSYYQELATSSEGKTAAKDINAFKTKASSTGSGGFYIGRYEARKNSNGAITEKGTDTVWNYITQPDAATQARNMYRNATTYTSDLVNSYAWDTATLFLQTFGTDSEYSRQESLNTSLATKGTNNQTTKDVQCNVYDMASNTRELTTETSSNSNWPCVTRGGNYYSTSSYYTSDRDSDSTYDSSNSLGFRPLLYL